MDLELDLTDEEIDHLRRQAEIAGLSEHDYAVSAIRVYLRRLQSAEAAPTTREMSAAVADSDASRERVPKSS